MNETRLSEVLERVTADLPSSRDGRDRGTDALRRARVVRRRRAGSGVAAVAAVAVLAIALPQVASGPDRTPSPAPSPSLSPTPTFEPTEVAPAPIEAADYPKWDPFTLADSPRAESVLPEVLDPPETAPSVLDQPLEAAVVAWPEAGRDLMLLGVDGSWRSVPGTSAAATGRLYEVVVPVLTLDGRQVAMSTKDGVLFVDIAEGTRQLVPWPPEIPQPTDTLPGLDWLPGDEEVHVHYWNRQWVVGTDGTDREAPWSERGRRWGYPIAVDPEGPIRQHRYDHNDLITWLGDEVVSDAPAVWWGERYVARHGLVAFTGNPATGAYGGPTVVRGDTAELLAWLRTPDPNSEYSDNGYLTVKGFLDEQTVLMLVAPMRFGRMEIGEETWYLATWDFETGEIAHLTTGDTRMRTLAVATDVVR